MDMGMVNAVIPHAELEDTAYECTRDIRESPMAIKCLNLL
jgi:naphthoate synthase